MGYTCFQVLFLSHFRTNCSFYDPDPDWERDQFISIKNRLEFSYFPLRPLLWVKLNLNWKSSIMKVVYTLYYILWAWGDFYLRMIAHSACMCPRQRVVKGGSRSRFTENKLVLSRFTKNKIGISPFTEKKMKTFFHVNRDFHSSREAWFCKIIFRETRNKCLIRREPWFSLCLCYLHCVTVTSWLIPAMLRQRGWSGFLWPLEGHHFHPLFRLFRP